MPDADYGLFAEEIAIQQRSMLYHLPMEGIGTVQQESLQSYLHRLAGAHHVRVHDLLSKIIIPETKIQVGGYWFHFSEEHSRTVNGHGKYAHELSRSASRLTGVPGLSQGTFIHWQELFDSKAGGLLHPKRRWCPTCMDDADKAGQQIIFPLLWSARCVTHCSVHMVPLVSQCIGCGAEPKHVSELMAVGRCDSCGRRLGWRSGLLELSETITEKSRFVSESIAEMIALGEKATDLACPDLLSRVLKEVSKVAADGSVFKLARQLKVGKHTLAAWANFESKPRLDTFIEVCYRIGQRPTALLTGKAFGHDLSFCPGAPPRPRKLHRLAACQVATIEAEISRIIQSNTVFMNAKDLAIKHNTSVGFLRYQLPTAYAALMAHRKLVQASNRDARLLDRANQARTIVRQLFLQATHVPKARLAKAFHEAKLTYSADVLTVARSELILLRQGQLDLILEAHCKDEPR
ncbi:MAG: hypothetical protein EON58_00255 [Alphaproteobacteria bacterium]|nr:MAG: hypothetical protein EON58_00255 [Alphaproteobacteria bacterium]